MRRPGSPKDTSWRSIIRGPAFLLANLALLLVIGVSTVRETYRGWSVDQEIRALDAQAATLEGRKTQLDTLANDLMSPERVDYEARARLGQKKAGERVVILEGMNTTSTWSGGVAASSDESDDSSKTETSNPEKWLSYFFHHPNS